jgi:hypothetical protein
MLLRTVLTATALLAGATAASAAEALPEPEPKGRQVVTPGVTYESRTLSDGNVLHIVRSAPKARFSLQPESVGPSLSSRESVASHVAAQRGSGAVAAVNGDFFGVNTGHPSGALVKEREILSDPEPNRSALVLPLPRERISVAKLTLEATWGAERPNAAPPILRKIQAVNRPRIRSSETILFTRAYGATTPSDASIFEVSLRLTQPGPVSLGETRQATVVRRSSGGGSELAEDQIVLAGAGSAANRLRKDLELGTTLVVSTDIPGAGGRAIGVIGGGPALVQDGRPVLSPGESFTSSQLGGRTSRTAIAQHQNGQLLLVGVEGPLQGRPGLSTTGLARELVRLGARTAIGLDSGGSAQLVVGPRSAIPWRSPRAVSTAAVLRYTGLQLDPLPGRLTPNGDGATDTATATLFSPSPGAARVTARRRGGGAVVLADTRVGPGAAQVAVDPKAANLRDGVWTIRARHVPDDGARPTAQSRKVLVDRTLGDLVTRGRRVGGEPTLEAIFRLTRGANVTVTIRRPNGRVLETVRSGRRMGSGRRVVRWDRTVNGKPVGGVVRVDVVARGPLGNTGLTDTIRLPKAARAS